LVLNDVLKNIQIRAISGIKNLEIRGITEDSRRVQPGCLFAAVAGSNLDGHRFIGDALRRGAVAILSEGEAVSNTDVTWIQVNDSRLAFSKAAANFYAHPSSKMTVVGITGTNGKTTVSYLVKNILEASGRPCGIIGTVEYCYQGQTVAAVRTTPDAQTLQELLRKMRDGGTEAVAMEVSSHSLDQRRVDGVDFDVGIFTNLTQDHLDYHRTMEQYLEAKQRLFTRLLSGESGAIGVINVDDDAGCDIVGKVNFRCLTYGINNAADVKAEKLELYRDKSLFTVSFANAQLRIKAQLLGRHNVYNCLAAIACGFGLGIDPKIIKSAVEDVTCIPGRMERIDNSRGLHVFVDYAHTDDALSNVLKTLREITNRKIFVVFGCGGDRDHDKRPKMGRVASQMADFSIVTSDNPRSEDPEAIVAEVVRGFNGEAENYLVEIDRREAIRQAIDKAEPGDTVLIAGKGHENYQIFADRTIHFDDREVVEEILQ